MNFSIVMGGNKTLAKLAPPCNNKIIVILIVSIIYSRDSLPQQTKLNFAGVINIY